MPKGDYSKSSQLSKTKIQQIVELYESGLSMREVGLQFGISRQRVHQLLKRAKEEPKKSKQLSPANIYRLIKLYEIGLSMREVGLEFGISAQRVEQILKKAGIKKRKFTKSYRLLKARKEKQKILPKELLIKYYKDEKLSIPEILDRLKASRNMLYKSLEYHNIPKREEEGILDSKLSEELLRKLYLDENLTAVEIAQQLGYASVTIKKRLSKFGIRKGYKQT